jgi:hypothetical protein
MINDYFNHVGFMLCYPFFKFSDEMVDLLFGDR